MHALANTHKHYRLSGKVSSIWEERVSTTAETTKGFRRGFRRVSEGVSEGFPWVSGGFREKVNIKRITEIIVFAKP